MGDKFPHVVIVGGGFGGLATAKALRNAPVHVRERFHDNALGLHIQAGNWLTEEHLRMLADCRTIPPLQQRR